MSYFEKYIKYKNKYLNLKNLNLKNLHEGGNKVFEDADLNTKLKNFYNIIKNNDMYKKIYNKFIYLPLKNNIQIILRYYPSYNCKQTDDNCMVDIKDLYNIKNTLVETDACGNKYYYRNITHLHDMLKNEYINYFTINNIKINEQNIIPTLEWRDYVICPTIDPVHNNHVMLIRKQQLRMYKFYFPEKDNNVFKDMIDFSRLTGNYIYCSIEVGSIPEYVHFHTSCETPPLHYITNINKNNFPLYYNDFCRFYRIDYNGCYDCYYFEISNNFINDFANILPVILYNSRYIDKYKYMAQVFVCTYTYDFNRIVITFRRVKTTDTIPIDGNYSESYYKQLFHEKIELCYGKFIGYRDNLRFNILGYEPVTINFDPHDMNINKNKIINENNINEHCMDYTYNFFNNFCKNVFHFNNKFEENMLNQLNKVDFKKYDNSETLNDMFLYNRIVNNINKKQNSELIKLVNSTNSVNLKISKEINNNLYHLIMDNNFYTGYIIDKENLINHLYYSNKLYDINSLFHTKILNIRRKDDENYYILYNSINNTMTDFIDGEYKKYNDPDIKRNYSNVFFLLIVYQLYILFKDYNLLYTNFDINSIYITTDLTNDKNLSIELNFKSDKKILINHNNGKFNIYGFKPILMNINHLIESNDVKKFIKSLQKLKDIFINSDIKNELNLDLNYPECLYNFIDTIGNDNLNDSSVTRDNINIHVYHQTILKVGEILTGTNNLLSFKTDSFNELYDKIKQKKDDILSLIVLNGYEKITIPKNTKFISATSFNLQDFDETKEKYLLEYNWRYRQKNPNWFHSNFNLNLNDPNFKKITEYGINGITGDFYLKQPPFNFTRHLIFTNNRDIKLLVTEFDGIKRFNFHKKLISIIYDNIFDNIDDYYIDDQGTYHNDFDKIVNRFGISSIDAYIVFILNVLKENNLLGSFSDIDGYIGMDWFDKNYDKINGTNVEYVLLEPSYLNLIGLYYYDYYENNFKLFNSYHKWNNFMYDRISKYKNILNNTNHVNNPYNKISYFLRYPFDYSLIAKKYVFYLRHILEDIYVLNNNDFYNYTNDSDNKVLTYKIDIID